MSSTIVDLVRLKLPSAAAKGPYTLRSEALNPTRKRVSMSSHCTLHLRSIHFSAPKRPKTLGLRNRNPMRTNVDRVQLPCLALPLRFCHGGAEGARPQRHVELRAAGRPVQQRRHRPGCRLSFVLTVAPEESFSQPKFETWGYLWIEAS